MAFGVNYLIVKLIIIVIINAATNTVITNADDYPFEVFMISPNTPVYYMESTNGNKVKLTEKSDIFRATQAYKHYNNRNNDRSNTFVLNILLILDNPNGNEQNEIFYTDSVLGDFNYAASSMDELGNPKIKLHISGVLKMKQVDTTAFTIRREVSLGTLECYGINSAYDKLSEWLFDNSATLSKIDYDMFIFASNKRLCHQNNGLSDGPPDYLKKNMECAELNERIRTELRTVYFDYGFDTELRPTKVEDERLYAERPRVCSSYNGLLDGPSHYVKKNIDCINKGDSGYPSGGLFYTNNINSEVHLTQMIAEKFGVRSDSNNECTDGPDDFSGSYMNLGKDGEYLKFSEWSRCSKADFAKIIDNKNFECYKMPVATDVEKDNESGYKNLILGPNTYVHRIDFSRYNFMKVESDLNKFQATPTYNYYTNSDVDISNTYVVNILLIYDWRLNEINKDSNVLSDSILKQLNIVAANLNKLQHIKIKLRISGIVLPQRSDIFILQETPKMPMWEESCYQSSASLRYLSNWLQENKVRFENLSYDFFLFVTSRYICDQSNEKISKTGAIIKNDCNSPSTSSGGLIQYGPFFSLHVTQMIAERFNIGKDDVLNCGSGHIMDLEKMETCVTPVNPRSWSECSQSAFESISRSPAYSCNKMKAFKPEGEEDEDYQ